MATAGGSRRKCYGKPLVVHYNVAALLKHSDAQSSDSSQRIVPAASAQPRIASRRISGCSCGTPSRAACPALNSRDIVLSSGPFCCGVNGVVKSRQIPRSLQKSTKKTNTVQILRVIVSAERVWDSHICHKVFHNRNKTVRAPFARAVRPLSTRSAVDEHHNVPRPPERSWVRSSSVVVDKSQQLRCSPRHVMWSGWPIPFCPRTSQELNQFSYQADLMLFRCHFQYTRIGVGKENVKVVNVYSLVLFH